MPRFDFYIAFSFDDYDNAARLVRALQAEGKKCFTDSFICEEVAAEEEIQAALDYSDCAIVVIGKRDNAGVENAARLAAGIGLFVSLIKTEEYDLPADIASYRELRIYNIEGAEWEKKVADAIIADNPVDEDTAAMLKMMSVFEQDNEKFVMEYSLKKLARLKEAAKKEPGLVPVYVRGVFESAKLDWNNADKEELKKWWDALSFAREHACSSSIADIRLIESMMYRVKKILFP